MNRQEVESTIKKNLELLHPPGSTIEIRALKVPGRGMPYQSSGYFDDFGAAAACAAELDSRDPGPLGIFMTMNPVKPALLARSPNRMTPYLQPTTSDADIQSRLGLLVDIDPDRPSGIPSSDDELKASKLVAKDVRRWLVEEKGFAPPAEAMSGNGWHLIFPIDLPNDEHSLRIVHGVLQATAAMFGGDRTPSGLAPVKIDTTVGNAARITKVYGTLVRKGYSIPGRPLRRSELMHVPESFGHLIQGGAA